MHADAWDGEDYDGGTLARRGKTLTPVDMFFDAAYELDIQESRMVFSTSTSNMGLKFCTIQAFEIYLK